MKQNNVLFIKSTFFSMDKREMYVWKLNMEHIMGKRCKGVRRVDM